MDRRSLLNSIIYVVRAGCAWRLLPSDLGPWQTVYGYFRVLSQEWTGEFIHHVLRDRVRQSEGCRVVAQACQSLADGCSNAETASSTASLRTVSPSRTASSPIVNGGAIFTV
jgi:putative transposase